MEYKALTLEVDSLSHEKGTATIAHAVYGNIDLVGDIANKGMFNKTWKEKNLGVQGFDISFYLNHDDTQAPGKVIGAHDNDQKAFTDVKMGTHTLGRDTLIMMDEGTIRKSSFGFLPTKFERKSIKSKTIRSLQEVNHMETSVLTRLSANPLAGIEKVNKQLEQASVLFNLELDFKMLDTNEQTFLKDMLTRNQKNLESLVSFSGTLQPDSDLYTSVTWWITRLADSMNDMKSCLKYNCKEAPAAANAEIKAHIAQLRKFCRNTKASDTCIQEMEREIKSLEQILSLNTDDTPIATEPSSSDEESQLADGLLLLSLKHF